jgi:hypothetical protein
MTSSTGNVNSETKPESSPKKYEELIGGVLKDGRMFETVFDYAVSKLSYAVRDSEGKWERQTSIVVNNKTYVPPDSELSLLDHGILLLPSDAEPYGTPLKLLLEIEAFIHRYLDVSKFDEALIAHYVMMTWMFDKFSAVPYLRLLGEPGTGKTRILKIVKHLSYRGIFFGGSSSPAALFRMQNTFRGTISFDEADFGQADMNSDVMKILNAGYSRGTPVMRAGSKENGFKAEAFDVFGPKALANRHRFGDVALETRCLTIQTSERQIRDEVPVQLPETFYEESLSLRNELLAWRMEHHQTLKVDSTALRELSPRRAEISTPIYNVSPDEDFKAEFLAWQMEQDDNAKAENPILLVVDILGAFVDLGVKIVHTKRAAERIQMLAGRRGMDSSELHERRINQLALSLGFRKKQTNTGTAVLLESKTMNEARGRYRRTVSHPDVAEVMKGVDLSEKTGPSKGLLKVINVNSVPELNRKAKDA